MARLLQPVGGVDYLQEPAFRDALDLLPAPPPCAPFWSDVDLLVRSRIRMLYPDVTDDQIWDMLERS